MVPPAGTFDGTAAPPPPPAYPYPPAPPASCNATSSSSNQQEPAALAGLVTGVPVQVDGAPPPDGYPPPPHQQPYPYANSYNAAAYPPGPYPPPPPPHAYVATGVAVNPMAYPPPPQPHPPITRPLGTKVEVHQASDSLIVQIPALGMSGAAMCPIVFGLVWTGITVTFLVITILSPAAPEAKFFFGIFLGLFVLAGLWMIFAGVQVMCEKQELRFEGDVWELKKSFLCFVTKLGGPRQSITAIKHFVGWSVSDNSVHRFTRCVLIEGAKEHPFGEYISEPEQMWILHNIGVFLRVPWVA